MKTKNFICAVSTHSRPKAAGRLDNSGINICDVSTHSRPKAAGASRDTLIRFYLAFQLTAARRRLGRRVSRLAIGCLVSTHSRPKAAGYVV